MPDLASARELAVRMRDIGVRAGRPTVCELTAHGLAARRRGRQRARGRRGVRDAARAAGPATSASSCSGRPRAWPCSPTSASSSRRAAGWPRRRSPRARRCARSSGCVEAQGGDPRLAERPWEVLETAPVVARRAGAASGLGGALRRARDRSRRDAPGRRARAQGGCHRPRGRASSCTPSRATRSRRASRSRTCFARDGRGGRGRGRRGARRLRLRRRSRRAPAAAARDDRLTVPELPEVETVRRRPAAAPHRARAQRGAGARPPADRRPSRRAVVAARLEGVRIEALGRRGKYLIAELDDGAALLVHLRMTGNLLLARRRRPASRRRFLRAWAQLDDGSYLAYTDARRFGTWRVAEDGAEAVARRQARPGAAGRLGGRRPGARVRGPPARPSRQRCSISASSPASATSTPTRRCGRRGSIRWHRPAGSRARASRACTQP